MRLTATFLIVSMLLSACVAPSGKGDRRQRKPQTVRVEPDTRQCLSDLDRMRARYSLLPAEDFGGGCALKGAVQLHDVGVPVTNVRAIRCLLARNVTLWVREVVQPEAREHFGKPVVRMESMGAYACRNKIGNASVAGSRSEHATGNAIDVAAFILSDGRRISVLGDWNGESGDARRFLRDVRQGACARFQTVLSPDYNAAHRDHFHFDMGRGPFCR
jgi:hypothetical protein